MENEENTDDEDIKSISGISSSTEEIDNDDFDSDLDFGIDGSSNFLDKFDKEIYRDSQISLKHFISNFIETFSDIKISKKILQILLKFIRSIVPNDNLNMPTTLKGLFDLYDLSKVKSFKICAKCSDEIIDDSICQKDECLRFKRLKSNKNKMDPMITEFDLTNELKNLLTTNWLKILTYRETLSSNLVSDICNSEHYTSKQLSINSISFILFIDGAQFNKGHSGTIWAILGIIANMPPLVRSAFSNIIKILFIHGNLFDFNGIFAKHLTKLTDLLVNGIDIMVSNSVSKVSVHIHALIADNPGRSKICYCRQHNGRFGCFHCLSQCYTTDGEK